MQRRLRRRLTFRPVWRSPDGDAKKSFEAVAIKWISANIWRFASHFEFGDMLSECWIIFDRCCERYADVTRPQHFMTIYKRSIANYFNAELRKIYTQRKHVTHLGEFPPEITQYTPQAYSEIDAQIAIDECPDEFRPLIERFAFARPEDRPRYRRNHKGRRESTHRYLCRLAQMPADGWCMQDALRCWIYGEDYAY